MNKIVEEFVKNSKCQDVVYHGTRRSFDVFFKSNGFGSARYRTLGGKIAGKRQMFFFAKDPEIAGTYCGKIARKNEPVGPNIIPAYLNLENPLELDGNGSYWNKTFNDVLEAYDSGKYDGVIIHNTIDVCSFDEAMQKPTTVYASFNTEKILSATCFKTFGIFDNFNGIVSRSQVLEFS